MPETIRQEFNMTYPELITVCNTIHTFMVRDAAEFLANFGVTAIITAAFETKINDFEDYPTDDELRGIAQQKTQDKDVIAANLRIQIRSIAVRAKNVFGENSGNYNAFGVKDMNNFDDGQLINCGRRVARMSETFLTELAPEGLTQDIIDDLVDICNNFETAMDAQKLAIGNRNDASKVRVDMANELYALLTKYCDYGKDIWYNTNTAKYKDYVIYTGTSPGSLTAPQNFMFDPINYDFTWSAVENATSYILQESTDGTNWTQYWAGHETTCAYEESPTTIMYFRVLAHNAGGNSAPSNVIQYNFAPALVAPSNFNYDSINYYFTWNAVPNAEFYEFQYRAQTNPTWNSLNAGNATSFYHVDPIGNYLARVRAGNGPNLGTWSNELEYTVSGGPS